MCGILTTFEISRALVCLSLLTFFLYSIYESVLEPRRQTGEQNQKPGTKDTTEQNSKKKKEKISDKQITTKPQTQNLRRTKELCSA